MSLFKKNVPLQEEVAPVMQEYSGQHPVLNFTPVSAIVKSDHLDQYMEVHPFASSEPKLKFSTMDAKKKEYNSLMETLNIDYVFDFDFSKAGSVSIYDKQEPLTLEVLQINLGNNSRDEADLTLHLPVDIKGVESIEALSEKIKKMTQFATKNKDKEIKATSASENNTIEGIKRWKELKQVVYVPKNSKCSYKIK